MVTRRDYNAEAVNAACSVILELMHLLGEYRKYIVLIGGWVPELICTNSQEPHVGSMDVDLALDHKRLTNAGYRTIKELLLSRGYYQGKQPYIFHRKIKRGANEVIVEIDLLGGEYGGTEETHRTQKLQDIRVRKARGADLAFNSPIEIKVEGELPGGGKDSMLVRVASIGPFLVMKGMALEDRLKEKDSYDIYFCLRHYPGGIDKIIEEVKPYLEHGLGREGLNKIAVHFSSIDDMGPTHVANFQEVTDLEEIERLRRDAYERVSYLCDKLGIK